MGKKLLTIMIALGLSFSIFSVSLATSTKPAQSLYDSGAGSYNGQSNGGSSVSEILGGDPHASLSGGTSTISNILGAFQWIGYAIALGMLIMLGVKYVMSAAEDKASLKNMAFRYIMGVIIIAGASTILAIIRAVI